MSKWLIIAFADEENGLPRQKQIVEAPDKQTAEKMGWKIFPEYHEIGVYIMSWGKS